MSDIALLWDNDAGAADIGLSAGALVGDDGLKTAILISLFTDARADADDDLPDPSGDRRGWWGDAVAERPGDAIGSKLWLLRRSKIVPETLTRARDYARAALAWLVEDLVVKTLDVEVDALDGGVLAIAVNLTRPTGAVRRWDFVWSALA